MTDPADLDVVIYGVKIRVWKPEYVAAVGQKLEECVAQEHRESARESFRSVTRHDFQSRWPAGGAEYFKKRDENIRQEQAASQASRDLVRSVEAARKQGVDVRPSGTPGGYLEVTIRYFPGNPEKPRRWSCRETYHADIGWIDDDSIKALTFLTDLCLQGGATPREAAVEQKARLDHLRRLYSNEIPKFAQKVAEAARSSTVTGDVTTALEKDLERLQAPGFPVQNKEKHHPQLDQARKQLAGLTEKLCEADFSRAQFPASWRTSYYLEAPGLPTDFREYVCSATKRGAQLRYLPKGLLSKEGFEIKGKIHTIQIFPESALGSDPKKPVRVPASVIINGKQITVTPNNFFEVSRLVMVLPQKE